MVKITEYRECVICKKVLPETEFYKPYESRGKICIRKSCGKCCREERKNSSRNKKQMLLSLAGGKCNVCGYDKCSTALEFHHIDPSTKDPSYSGMTRLPLKKAFLEIKKCVLLCANCHREVHAGYIDLDKQNISNLQEL